MSGTVPAEVSLRLKYSGPDVDRGRMSAIELGPAIFGIGHAVGRASRVLFGDEQRVKVEVNADFKHGSLGVDFLAISPSGQLIPPLSPEEIQGLLAILGVLGGVPGLVQFVQWIRGRRIENVERDGDEYVVRVGDEAKSLSADEYRVFTDPDIRKDMKAIVAPLQEGQVTELEMQSGAYEPVTIDSTEREHFDIKGLPQDDVGEERSTQIVEVLSPAFQQGNKWYLAQGEAKYYATIEDSGFLEKVARREYRFGHGDALRVEMVTEVTRDEAGKLRFDRRVTRVLKHIAPREGDQLDALDGP